VEIQDRVREVAEEEVAEEEESGGSGNLGLEGHRGSPEEEEERVRCRRGSTRGSPGVEWVMTLLPLFYSGSTRFGPIANFRCGSTS